MMAMMIESPVSRNFLRKVAAEKWSNWRRQRSLPKWCEGPTTIDPLWHGGQVGGKNGSGGPSSVIRPWARRPLWPPISSKRPSSGWWGSLELAAGTIASWWVVSASRDGLLAVYRWWTTLQIHDRWEGKPVIWSGEGGANVILPFWAALHAWHVAPKNVCQITAVQK